MSISACLVLAERCTVQAYHSFQPPRDLQTPVWNDSLSFGPMGTSTILSIERATTRTEVVFPVATEDTVARSRAETPTRRCRCAGHGSASHGSSQPTMSLRSLT